MITKTEVHEAIAVAEPKAAWSPLDMSAVTISRGALRVLVEAAKCARYEVIDGYVHAASTSGAILNQRQFRDMDYSEDLLDE